MKREILFKAQRTDGKGWVEGFFTKKEIGSLICPVIERHSEWDNGDSIEAIEINGETVCEYTGLEDKNGRKIFEGDIVNCRIPMEEDGLHPCTVEFDEEGQWVFINNRLDIADAFGLVEVFNVTGNIHDND